MTTKNYRRDLRIREYLADPALSYQDIAAMMGCTRSTVAGVAYRQGGQRNRRGRRYGPRKSKKKADPVVEAGAEGVSLLDLPHAACRYVIAGEGAKARFCGKAPQAGSIDWCEEHYAKTHEKRSGGKWKRTRVGKLSPAFGYASNSL